MDLYLDKANLYSLIKAADDSVDKELYSECCRLLRRNLHLVFNFAKNEISMENDKISAWLDDNGVTGRGWTEDIDEFRRGAVCPSVCAISNEKLDWELLTSAFLLNDLEKVNTLKDTISVLAEKEGNELKLLKLLFCDRDSYDLHRIYSIRDRREFPNWEILKKNGHIMPCSDIIIADRYLFNDEKFLDANIFTLLRMFAEVKQGRSVNLVFFTDKMPSEKVKSISRTVKQIFKNEARVTFVFYEKGNERPHDRFILTNYVLFRSGDSFNNYFRKNGSRKTEGITLDVDSLANSRVVSVVRKIQNWFQDISDNRNLSVILGDKESNFIKFKKIQ